MVYTGKKKKKIYIYIYIWFEGPKLVLSEKVASRWLSIQGWLTA